MIIDSTTSNALYVNLSPEFTKGFESYKKTSDIFTKKVSSISESEVYGWFGPSPGFMEWKKNTSRTIRNVNQLDYKVTNKEYEDTISISKNDVADNTLLQYNEQAFNLGADAAQKEDELVYSLFNNGFTTNTTYDGLSWFNDAHTAGLKVIDNKGTGVLSKANLKIGITAMRSFKSQGDKLSDEVTLNPAVELILLVPPALEWTATILVENERDATGATNELKGKAKLFVSNWLTSDTAWFLINTASPMKPIFFQEREKVQFYNLNANNSDMALMNGSFIYSANFRGTALPTLPWFVYGSTGTS